MKLEWTCARRALESIDMPLANPPISLGRLFFWRTPGFAAAHGNIVVTAKAAARARARIAVPLTVVDEDMAFLTDDVRDGRRRERHR